MADDIDTDETEPAPEPDVAASPPPGDGEPQVTGESVTARSGPGAGVWAAIAVGVVVLVVAAAAIGYYVGRGDDTGAAQAGGTGGTADTKRTDQELCAELLGALREVAASPNPADGPVLLVSIRAHVAGLLSDAPTSATTAAVQGVYDAAGDLVAADALSPVPRSTYEEKLAIAKYQCDKIATWDWPAT